ncbi:hypothetical protein F5884DRAFT_785183 [Xylogone sp. PMI_703]|nr:hypothetical protein F5884DRAFT_785183 [Xylogone sp. PMI_703]
MWPADVSDPNDDPATFTLFSKLPPELRYAIWKYCLPSRVVELDSPRDDAVRRPCDHDHSSRLNTQCPIITKVCHESRMVAFDNGDMLGRGGDPRDKGRLPVGFLGDRWFNPTTDVIHINWDGIVHLMNNDTFNPMRHFLWNATKSCAPASIMADLVGGGLVDNYSCAWNNPAFDLLKGGKEYTVTLQMIDLHVTLDQAIDSELFGRLGEERVKLVDADDEETILKYHELWGAGPYMKYDPTAFVEIAVSPRMLHKKIKTWNEALETKWLRNQWYHTEDKQLVACPDLIWLGCEADQTEDATGIWNARTTYSKVLARPNKDHPWVSKMLETMPVFSPVIMFRFCEGGHRTGERHTAKRLKWTHDGSGIIESETL